MQKLTAKQAEKLESFNSAKDHLLTILKPSNKVYTTVHKISSSGMSRTMGAYVVVGEEITCINWYIEKLGLFKRNDQGHLKVNGCGMDMGFHLVYNLGRVLFPEGFTGYQRNGGKWGRDQDGGYALKQVWL
jgi:hypothetical protein